jgi:hypothetical protein
VPIQNLEPTAGRRKLIALGVAVAAVGLTYVFWGTLWAGGGLIGGDTYSYYFPQKSYLVECLRRGELPLWNPLVSLGYPALAESQTAVLYPPNLILYGLLDVNAAYNAGHLLHYIAAYVFMWLFARRIGLKPIGSHLAAIVFVYGWFPTRACLEWAIIGGTYVPLILWCVESYLQTARWRWLFIAAVALGLFLLAGHFNLAYILLLVMAIYVPARLFWEKKSLHERLAVHRGRECLKFIAPIVLGFAIAAAQILPTIELKSVSQRDASYSNQTYGSIPVWYLSQVLWPLLWYGPEMNPDQVLGGADSNKIEAHLYFGVIPFYLLVLGGLFSLRIGYRPSRKVLLWGALAIAAAAFATGWPIRALRWMPGFSFFAGPGRYGIVTSLAVGLGAGAILDVILSTMRLATTKLVLIVLVFGLTVADLWFVSQWVTNVVQVHRSPADFRRESAVRQLLDRESQPVRAFAPGPNLPTITGLNCAPEYLGIGPAAYYDDARKFPRPKKEKEPTPEDFLRQREWLQRAGVTHVVRFEPQPPPGWPVEPLGVVVDPFLNAAWARAPADRLFVDRLTGSRPLAFFADESTPRGQTVERRGANEVAVNVDDDRGGTLVLLDLAYPGWKVSIDGAPANPLVFEETFRAVDVRAGRHEVVWKYEPASATWGALISGLAILIWMFAAVIVGRSGRSKPAA